MAAVASPSWIERPSARQRHADDVRTDYEIDYARVVHSGAFRRLQGKTQILSLGDDDFYRSRLTHSMEVAQVAEGIAQHLRASTLPDRVAELVPPAPLIQAVGLAHDLGHPPFGHGGELALNYCMREAGGFEGNAQTLRLLSQLEHFSDGHGADLTRRTLLGTLKYPLVYSCARNPLLQPALNEQATTIRALNRETCKPVKACYDDDAGTLDWILAPLAPEERGRFQQGARDGKGHARALHRSFDCSIMNAADDIAYGVHDLEDAIALGFIGEGEFRAAIVAEPCAHLLYTLAHRPLVPGGRGDQDELVERLFGLPEARKGAIGRLVHYFIRSCAPASEAGFEEPLLAWRVALHPEADVLLATFQRLIVKLVINSPRVQHLEFKGQRMVIAVAEALLSDPARLLPASVQESAERASLARAVCDFVASFTDRALLRTYERLFSPRTGSIFDRI